jgi:hypothetical protein
VTHHGGAVLIAVNVEVRFHVICEVEIRSRPTMRYSRLAWPAMTAVAFRADGRTVIFGAHG